MKTKFLVFFLLITAISQMSYGQVTDGEKTLRSVIADTLKGWKTHGVISVNLGQTSLTNWSAGGQNSVAINGLFSGFAEYRKNKYVWTNSLDLGYGILKQGTNGVPMKTDDKIDFLSKFGMEAFKNVYYAALLNFKTQMTPGYKYPDTENKISNLFAPAYLLVALGADYKPDKYFSAFIAPLTDKYTFVRDQKLSDAGAFGVTPGKKSLQEIGGYLRAIYSRSDFKSEALKNISFTTKIDLFSNYGKNPQNVVVNWETLISLKVNKFISASLNTQLIYDDKIKIPFDKNGDGIIADGEAVGSKIQFKEILGVGFSYNFK